MDVDGAWRTTSCDTKLQGAMCGVNSGECHLLARRGGQGVGGSGEDSGRLLQFFTLTGPPPRRRISYHGSCPQGLADSAWIPFREHCYSFHMELLLGHKEALQRCQKGGQGQARTRPLVGTSGDDPSHGHSDPMSAVPIATLLLWTLTHKCPVTFL